MKKLFVLIFTLTLSTNAFSWTSMTCDEFLDDRKKDKLSQEGMLLSVVNRVSWTFYIMGSIDNLSDNKTKALMFNNLISGDPSKYPVTLNQMLYLIENKCRDDPTRMVLILATMVYRKIVDDWATKNILK